VILGGIGYVSFSDGFTGGPGLLNSRLLPRVVVTAVALTAVLGSWRSGRQGMRLWLSVWLAFALLSITLSGRSHDHYLAQLFPVACILAAAASQRLAAAVRSHTPRPGLAVASGIAVIGLVLSPAVYATVFIDHAQRWAAEGRWDGLPWETQPLAYYQNWLSLVTGKMSRSVYDSSFDHWTNIEDLAALAEYLDHNTPPGTPIYQWGYAPQLYVLADRPPAGPYVAETLYYVTSEPPAAMIADLRNHPPVLFVVLARLDRFPQLRDWVGNEYAFDRMVGHLEVYRLGDSLPSVARDDVRKGF
jgi:hypothetical protein